MRALIELYHLRVAAAEGPDGALAHFFFVILFLLFPFSFPFSFSFFWGVCGVGIGGLGGESCCEVGMMRFGEGMFYSLCWAGICLSLGVRGSKRNEREGKGHDFFCVNHSRFSQVGTSIHCLTLLPLENNSLCCAPQRDFLYELVLIHGRG